MSHVAWRWRDRQGTLTVRGGTVRSWGHSDSWPGWRTGDSREPGTFLLAGGRDGECMLSHWTACLWGRPAGQGILAGNFKFTEDTARMNYNTIGL